MPHCYEVLKDDEKWKKRDGLEDLHLSNKRKRAIEMNDDEEEDDASSDDGKRSPTPNSVSYSKPKRPDVCEKDAKEKKKRKRDDELKFADVLGKSEFISYHYGLLFDKNLKKGYDTISVLLSYFSKSYLLIFIILLLPVFMENFKILKMIEKYIRKNGDDELSHMKNKRSYLRTMGYNRRKNNSYRMFLGKIRNRK